MCKEGASREDLNPHMEQTHIIIYIDNSKIPYHTCILTYESEFRLWKNTRHSRHSFSVTTWYHISVPDTRASFSFLLPQLATIKMRLILIQYKHIKFNITVGLTLAPFEKGPSQPRALRIYEIIKEKFIYIKKKHRSPKIVIRGRFFTKKISHRSLDGFSLARHTSVFIVFAAFNSVHFSRPKIANN